MAKSSLEFAFGNKFELEAIYAVGVVEIFGIRRVAKHGKNPAEAGAAIKHGGKNFPRVAKHGGDARLARDGINQADCVAIISKFPRFEDGKVSGGGEQCAPGFQRDERGRGEFWHIMKFDLL